MVKLEMKVMVEGGCRGCCRGWGQDWVRRSFQVADYGCLSDNFGHVNG